jgi:CheY-like chemotaxis protein
MTNGGSLTIATRLKVLDKEYSGAIGTIPSGHYMVLSVEDSGEGISAANISLLCEPFYTTKEKKKGTGLGLSIISRIAREHNGYLNITSQVNRGTTFEIFLPIMVDQREENRQIPLLTEYTSDTASPTILLADDDKLIRKSISMALKQKGIKVLQANDGAEAISIYLDNRHIIDLALLDIVMPKKNGWEVYDIIRKDRPDFKAIFISGHTDNIITNKIVAEENLRFMAKPLDIETLLAKVNEVLHIKSNA